MVPSAAQSLVSVDELNATYTASLSCTVETCITEPVFIRTLRLKFCLLDTLNKSIKEAESGNGSYVIDLILFELKIQEQNLS